MISGTPPITIVEYLTVKSALLRSDCLILMTYTIFLLRIRPAIVARDMIAEKIIHAPLSFGRIASVDNITPAARVICLATGAIRRA